MLAFIRLEKVMSSTPPPPSEADPPLGEPAPLTCNAKDGKLYVRHADVQEEMRKALAAEATSWALECLKSETLVHLIRSLRWRDEMANVLGRLFDQLGRRVAVIVGDYSKGFPQSVRKEIIEHVSHKVLVLVLAEAPTRKSEFLEIEFKRVVKGLTLNEVEKRTQQPRPHQFTPIADDPENAGDRSSELADEGPGPEEIARKREACQLIRTNINSITNPRHREAVILHYFEGWPITDQDPTIPTLSNHFGVSDRQIRNWMRKAEDEIRKAIGEEP